MNDEGSGAAATATMMTEAAFDNVPSEHEGAGATFTFGLMFSEEPDVGYQTLRDHAFECDGRVRARGEAAHAGQQRGMEHHGRPRPARRLD